MVVWCLIVGEGFCRGDDVGVKISWRFAGLGGSDMLVGVLLFTFLFCIEVMKDIGACAGSLTW